MSRVFITGGSGFIGTNTVDAFQAAGFEVLNFDIKPPLDERQAAMFHRGDILSLDQLSTAMSMFQPEFVVHLAARCDLDGKTIDDYPQNTIGVQNVIEAVRRSPSVQRVIFTSSRYVHRTEHQPLDDTSYSFFTAYGESKAAGEGIVRSSGLELPWVLIRPTSIWGPWFDIPYKGFFSAVRRGLYVHPGNEKLYKTYGYVGNVVHQIRSFLEAPAESINRKTFYVADYQPIEIGEFAELIRDSFGAPPVRKVPLPIMKGMAITGDLLKKLGMKNPPLTSFRLNNLRAQMPYNMSATEQIAGPSPYSLKQGVDLTVAWMKLAG